MIDPIPCKTGRNGSRYDVNTPSLILDLDALERNIARMANIQRSFGRDLRPHAKTHKCSRIARMQIEAGASGVCCATLDEAEVMAEAGIPGILITSPITTSGKIERLVALAKRAPDTMLVADHPGNVTLLGQAARRSGARLNLLVDVELGFGRTGVGSAEDAVTLARAIGAEEGLSYAGIQAYGGHLQHVVEYGARLEVAGKAGEYIAAVLARLEASGLKAPLVTGGGTGTHAIDGRHCPFTENQAGSYVFMDADYRSVAFEEEEDWPFETALFVQTAVISNNGAASATTDAGTKAFALNGPRPVVVSPGLTGAGYDYSGDEHGRLTLAPGQRVELGQRIECMVSHCDPTVVLYDHYHCVRGDTLVDIWPVDARGRRAYELGGKHAGHLQEPA